MGKKHVFMGYPVSEKRFWELCKTKNLADLEWELGKEFRKNVKVKSYRRRGEVTLCEPDFF